MTGYSDLYEVDGDDIVLRVHAQPGAGRGAVVGRHGGALKVKVAAPPVEGRANAALVELLARTFGIKENQVSLSSGDSSRTKQFRLAGVAPELVDAALAKALSGAGGRGSPARH
jgi:uncharacterized protein (TIGR00251 family)